jgi:pSer/pThr/pTyr-binding forkhead associated (FHA) protein
MDKCPFCGAETRSGDNFCLNCGNRLVPASSSPQQVQPTFGDATLPAQDGWALPDQGTIPAAPAWGNSSEPTILSTDVEQATLRPESATAVGQATIDHIEKPARLILRAENGSIVKEFPLEKLEMSIGRAPTSDILLSKDKLTSRRHATIRYESEEYVLHDEHSANGTFVNGQQLEEMGTALLKDGDRIGIGEHELVFRAFGSTASEVEDLPTIAVPYDAIANELTFRTRDDEMATATENGADDEYGTRAMNGDETIPPATSEPEFAGATPAEIPPSIEPTPAPTASFPSDATMVQPAPAAAASSKPAVPVSPAAATSAPWTPSSPLPETGVTFSRITAMPLPALPDISSLMAALSALDGQVMSLQDQLNTTQESLRTHESEVTKVASQLRTGVRRVSDRMDSTIADVARKREELSWAELLQLMEDVENNPRDIEYVTKLARKARELRKVFQIHQNVLGTMAECNSLLRGLLGEER